ncbi:MAG: hypothetical protein IPJ89_04805 [Candidatus Iainarchaeum archaeon]|uniref:Uncharacterized protein n=1 Tax=Candidatus Iainarchaeum sp. TaxID=3101447 RepID=A0A7T9DJE9_9ARCH|nr:MAG: hypothetical protein IPJ89_04805 [Candidatus Diapherotrites archaeon]
MRIHVSPRRIVKRITDKIAGGKNIRRKPNQIIAAKRELISTTLPLTPKNIRTTIRSRNYAARLAHSRLAQLRSMKKVLAENPARAQRFIELATNEEKPEQARIYWWIAEQLLDSEPGIKSMAWIKQLIRDMRDPQKRKQRIAELKQPFIPEGILKQFIEEQKKQKPK